MVQSLSFGYEDNFMRFSDLDMVSYYDETNMVNDYFGDSKYYDSAIISPSLQIILNSKFKDYKTNLIFKSKFSEYVSSNLKSFAYFSTRFELKLKSYNWIKFSYSLVPKYYLRTFIDRDILPTTTPDMLMSFGQSEIKRINKEMKRIQKKLKFHMLVGMSAI